MIGAHPHVLQPIVRPSRRRVVAYSLGNFVWSAGSPATARTGLLTLKLSARGVESFAFRRRADRRHPASTGPVTRTTLAPARLVRLLAPAPAVGDTLFALTRERMLERSCFIPGCRGRR